MVDSGPVVAEKDALGAPHVGERSDIEKIFADVAKLARFVLAGWRGKQQGIIDGLSQAKSRRNVPPQIGDNHLLVDNGPIRASIGSIGRQGDIYNAVHEAKCGSILIKNEGRMDCINYRDSGNVFGASFGIVCHDGSSRFWKWDSKRNILTALPLPRQRR
jgi:hypothetical protein